MPTTILDKLRGHAETPVSRPW